MKVKNEAEVGPWSADIKCKCGALLEVVVEDFQQYGSIDDGFKVGVVCSRCGNRIYIDDAPPIVWNTVS